MRKLIISVAAGIWCFSAMGQEGSDRLFQAIRNDDLGVLKAELGKGADVNTRDRRGATLLMHAAAFGGAGAVGLLLDSGADVNAKSPVDSTALLWGAGEPAKAKLLIDKGANVNTASKLGRTPLMVAAACVECLDTVRLLIAKGADVKARDGRGISASVVAAMFNNFDAVKLLTEKGAPADDKDGQGNTVLSFAASYCDLAAIKQLLAKGANVNAATTAAGEVKFGKIQLIQLTPLMFAVPSCPAEVVKTLIDAGAQVNAKDIREMTPLMLAVSSERQDPAVLRLLLKAGADVNPKSKAGETALDWAKKFGNRETVAALEAAGAKPGDGFQPPRRPAAPAHSAKTAVELGTGLLQRTSAEFFKQSGCVGCHHQPVALMASAAATARGIGVDGGASAGFVKMLEGQWTSFQETVQQRIDIGGLADQEIFGLLGFAAGKYPANHITDTLVGFVAAAQNRDGSWGLTGVSRAPMEESRISRTALSIRVLQQYSNAARKAELEKKIGRARTYLMSSKPQTNDDAALQVAGLHWSGAGADKVQRFGKALLEAQREDGGWAQNRNLQSDAFATGETLWALKESGVLAVSDPAYQRGVKSLLSTQWADGSWYVRSRSPKFQPYFQSGFPFDHDQWISSAATAWAVMALAPAAE